MKRFFTKTGIWLLAAAATIAVVLCVVSALSSGTGLLHNALGVIASPFRAAGSAVAGWVGGISQRFEDVETLQQENDELRARNVALEEDAKTAERLQGLLDLRDANNLQSTAARIISGPSDSWSTTVTIDKGTSSGLTVGMPVTASSGVIGQIVACGPVTSTVRLITDENSSVSAMVQSSRAQGMLEGTVTGQVQLSLIRSGQQVAIGDVVVTSGLGGVFPKGLPLGEVTSVEEAPGALYLDVTVEPFAHAESYEEVLVITSLTEEQQATAEDIAAADAQETGTAAAGDQQQDTAE